MMTNGTSDSFTRRTAMIIFLWMLAMLIGGLLLLNFADTLASALA
jgi:hypothetical protein